MMPPAAGVGREVYTLSGATVRSLQTLPPQISALQQSLATVHSQLRALSSVTNTLTAYVESMATSVELLSQQNLLLDFRGISSQSIWN